MKWYVIQTQAGKERLVKQLIENMVPGDLYQECKLICTERKKKYPEGWRILRRASFPGYLFLVTDQVEPVRWYLRKIPELTKLLGYDGEIVPISPEEKEILWTLINEENVIRMSYGIREGDTIRVIEGALKGNEFLIERLHRHKRKGYIRIPFLGQERLMEIGLEIVEKIPEKSKICGSNSNEHHTSIRKE